MIRVYNIHVFGWESAIRGMRNPMNSWDNSDSIFSTDGEMKELGPRDRKLMENLVKGGPTHAKFRRMINVQMDINAPLYWWKEFDTYKVGTVANSCSTMHTIHKRDLDISDFSFEYLDATLGVKALKETIEAINQYRVSYLETGNRMDWYAMIQLLPSSFNQLRTVQLNYEVLSHIYRDRKDHKLDEWRDFCAIISRVSPQSPIRYPWIFTGEIPTIKEVEDENS